MLRNYAKTKSPIDTLSYVSTELVGETLQRENDDEITRFYVWLIKLDYYS